MRCETLERVSLENPMQGIISEDKEVILSSTKICDLCNLVSKYMF